LNIAGGISLVILAALTLAVLYLWFLGIFGILGRKKYPELSGKYDSLVLVPAHNEAAGIKATLQSLGVMDTVGRLEIAVIADNCDDNTAEVAQASGITVLERKDTLNRGKGYALRWGMAQYNLDEFDAVVIVDADTLIKPNMLKAMAGAFEGGAGAVQVSNRFYIDQKSPLAYLQQMGNIAENILFYGGRSVLHLPILLRGTGMAVRTEVLKNHPWDSYSVTEDIDYAVGLIKEGVRIDFSTESAVESPATSTYDHSYTQKERWASGTFSLITEKMLSLIGFSKGRLDLLELAFSMLILSRPMLIFIAFIPLILSFFSASPWKFRFLIWAVSLIVLLVLYLVSGLFYMADKKAAFKALFHVPYFGFWLLILQLKALIGRKRLGWVRTERKDR
jgi:cellulose synthase/poly-beta-1,6-N-acetylglucosamine synthase-like glycosyltransferase